MRNTHLHDSGASNAWVYLLRDLLGNGEGVRPRGKNTVELLHHSIAIDMRHPIVLIRERKLNYSFAAAEALWILAGDNMLEPLTRYNSRMAEFSDDGKTLAGAYGPKVVAQLGYVLNTLLKDRDSRQAVMTIWERNPVSSKDIPCTIALQFMIRNAKLYCHAYMRSSDAWLGVPYDVFTFSMIAAQVACRYNEAMKGSTVTLGSLYLTAGSSHLYEEHWQSARDIMRLNYPSEAIELESDGNRAAVLCRIVEMGSFDAIIVSLSDCRDKQDAKTIWRIRP